MATKVPPLIGWREWLSLPTLGVAGIKAKIDTGARTSALHAINIELFKQDRVAWVRFWVQPSRKRSDIIFACNAPLLEQRMVRDSGGHLELRYVIVTPIRLGTQEWPIELTLTLRDAMLFRMLLGRNAIRNHFLVNPAASYLASDRLALSTIYPKVIV